MVRGGGVRRRGRYFRTRNLRHGRGALKGFLARLVESCRVSPFHQVRDGPFVLVVFLIDLDMMGGRRRSVLLVVATEPSSVDGLGGADLRPARRLVLPPQRKTSDIHGWC